MTNHNKKTVAIIGAGAAGLMAAEVLSAFDHVQIEVYEHKPTAARKILMAGKTGLNISHAEDLERFISRYTPSDTMAKFVRTFTADDIRAWMSGLGVASFVGSTGRIFPTQMKASVLVRAWLARLQGQGVRFFYRHGCIGLDGRTATFAKYDQKGETLEQFTRTFDAVILACGGGSYAKLGSDGKWQAWFDTDALSPLYASNVGIQKSWSPFMADLHGQAIKRVVAQVGNQTASGDIVISHYGLESGLIYRLNQAMRQQMQDGKFTVFLDLLPDKTSEQLAKLCPSNKKQSLNTVLKKLGLDAVKIALLRECTDKQDWVDLPKMLGKIKRLPIECTGFQPIDEAISTGGGVKLSQLDDDLQLCQTQGVFCAGEMLDWDAPTGGYLLTACFATGRVAGFGVAKLLKLGAK